MRCQYSKQAPFSDTKLCSLMSNALENAIQASKHIPDSNKQIIRLRAYSKNSKLCIDIYNSYQIEPKFHQGLPVSTEQGARLWHKKHGKYHRKAWRCVSIFNQGRLVYISG
ncbi:GHKL domain-containing protein [Lacrimispora sp.]|uniref:GHKL domain-containing protein n=1 Tax=Lacrimispora sp. TaxID=2719234 RepID=UPI0028B09D47|nr:GHKL domain-containing protein [Lacrimispora sp.]